MKLVNFTTLAYREFQNLRKTNPYIYNHVHQEITDGIREDPLIYRALVNDLQHLRVCRIDNYRIVFSSDKNGQPLIEAIGHRSTVYRSL